MDWINLWVLGPAIGIGAFLLLAILSSVFEPRFRDATNYSFAVFASCLLAASLMPLFMIRTRYDDPVSSIADPTSQLFTAFTLFVLLTSITQYIFLQFEIKRTLDHRRLIVATALGILLLVLLGSLGTFDLFPLYRNTPAPSLFIGIYLLSAGFFVATSVFHFRMRYKVFRFFRIAPLIMLIGLSLNPLFMGEFLITSISILVLYLGLTANSIFDGIIRPTVQRADQIVALNQELVDAYTTTLEGWARALELRDKETEGHSRRVTQLAVHLAEALGLPPDDLLHIRYGALLHDIGKMGLPDGILKKSGPLTPEERAEVEQHPLYAYDLIKDIKFLEKAAQIPLCHHEHWDGKGYPSGLAGVDIPLYARIFSVVDVWDAVTTDRPYGSAWALDEAKAYLEQEKGSLFDPEIVDIFFSLVFPD